MLKAFTKGLHNKLNTIGTTNTTLFEYLHNLMQLVGTLQGKRRLYLFTSDQSISLSSILNLSVKLLFSHSSI